MATKFTSSNKEKLLFFTAVLLGMIITILWQLLPGLIHILNDTIPSSAAIVVNVELSLIIGGGIAGLIARRQKVLAGTFAGFILAVLTIAEHIISGGKDIGSFIVLVLNFSVVSILGSLFVVWLGRLRQNSNGKSSKYRCWLRPVLITGMIFIFALSTFWLFPLGKSNKNTPEIILNPTFTIQFIPTALPTYTLQSSPTNLPTPNQTTPTIVTTSFKAESADVEAILRQCTEQWQSCWNMSASDATWTGLQVGTVGATYYENHYTIQRLLLYFDTQSIPENAAITHVVLHLHVGNYLNGDPTFNVVQSTAQLSPSVADFSHIGNISGGSIKPAHGNMWLAIPLSDTSLSWIIPAGTTRLALRNDLDLKDITPTKTNDALISLYESGQYAPYLDVTYSIP